MSEYKFELNNLQKLREKLSEELGDPVYPSWDNAFKKWQERAKSLPPMSFIYVFDYKKIGTILTKGLSVLGYRDDASFDLPKLGSLMHDNQKIILSLQAVYMGFYSSKLPEFANDKNLIRSTLRAYKDNFGDYWLGQQTLESFQVDASGRVVRLFAWVHILDKYNGEPIATRFSRKNSVSEKGLEKYDQEIKNVRATVFGQLGFTKQQRRVMILMSINSSSNDICETMQIDKATYRFHCRGILKQGRKVFESNEFKTAKDVVKYLEDQRII